MRPSQKSPLLLVVVLGAVYKLVPSRPAAREAESSVYWWPACHKLGKIYQKLNSDNFGLKALKPGRWNLALVENRHRNYICDAGGGGDAWSHE